MNNFQDANRAMIEENAGNPIADQKKALRVRIISGHKQSNLNTFRAASNQFRNNQKMLTLFEPQQKNLKCLLKIKGSFFKNDKYQASHVIIKPFKTVPLSGFSNLVTQSL